MPIYVSHLCHFSDVIIELGTWLCYGFFYKHGHICCSAGVWHLLNCVTSTVSLIIFLVGLCYLFDLPYDSQHVHSLKMTFRPYMVVWNYCLWMIFVSVHVLSCPFMYIDTKLYSPNLYDSLKLICLLCSAWCSQPIVLMYLGWWVHTLVRFDTTIEEGWSTIFS